MNQPDRYSRFVLPSGVPHAVEYKPDTKMRAAGTFTIWLEDHTIGNLVRQQLHSNPEVVFAGYRIPHPLNPVMVVRIQTTEHSNPPAAMQSAITALTEEVAQLKQQLAECAPRDEAPQQPQQQQYMGGYPDAYGQGYGAAPGSGYGYGGY